jgi:hypothetical protein
MRKTVLFLVLILGLFSVGCSRPKGGICSHCPVWWLDPICLTGGDVPDPIKPKIHAPPTAEADLIPGQENAVLQK